MPNDVVSPNGLATHLGMTRQNVARLTAEAALVQRSDGCYDQTREQAALHQAAAHLAPAHDAEHAAVKTEMLKLRLMEKRGQLSLQSDVDALVDKIAASR